MGCIASSGDPRPRTYPDQASFPVLESSSISVFYDTTPSDLARCTALFARAVQYSALRKLLLHFSRVFGVSASAHDTESPAGVLSLDSGSYCDSMRPSSMPTTRPSWTLPKHGQISDSSAWIFAHRMPLGRFPPRSYSCTSHTTALGFRRSSSRRTWRTAPRWTSYRTTRRPALIHSAACSSRMTGREALSLRRGHREAGTHPCRTSSALEDLRCFARTFTD